MSKRALIIYRVDQAKVSNNGVIKKLDGQAKGFRSNGWDVDTIRISNGNILLNKEPIKQISKSKFGSVLFEFFQSIGKEIDFTSYDLLYIRYGLSFSGFVSFLKQAKKDNSKLKILLEFATYPYTDEWSGAKGLVVKKVDSHYRKRLSNYVNHVIHLGEEKEILGMPCINSENGIDVGEIKIRSINSIPDKINLIAVGKWQFWHGLDRLINGIADCVEAKRSQIRLVIVGEGAVIPELKNLVRDKNLDQEVSFVGEKDGNELDSLFDKADVGIGTLGMHRKKIKIDSSLKHREYASRGLPFILCTRDLDFPKSIDFVKYYPTTEEHIDISSVTDFAVKMKEVEPNDIRLYAKSKLSWNAKVSIILEQVDFD